MRHTIICIAFILISLSVIAQDNFISKDIPNEYDYHLAYHSHGYTYTDAYLAQFDLTSKDHTDALQEVLNTHPKVILPNHSIYINKTGISLRNNSLLIGQKDTQLIMLPNDEIDSAVIKIENVEHVTIKGLRIVGDRDTRIHPIVGEWGHGVVIRNCSDILLDGLKIEKTIGDGVYIGQLDDLASKNIYVKNTVIDQVMRNGVSITSGRNIMLYNLFIANTHGTNPMCGIDIEPNSNRDFIENIFIVNTITYNNKVGGLKININKLGKGQTKKEVSIFVNHFKDYYSETGFISSNITVSPENFYGIIELSDLKFYYNNTPFNFKSSLAQHLKIKIRGIDWEHQYRKAFTKKRTLKVLKKRNDLKLIE
ncbi:MAG TPA: right-handed parallel beta-helix repeat-containing protein [Flavobacterium sp.]|nr:right-handed parallel beta-helix repeat-containing protein [Flavobacterium sp.]